MASKKAELYTQLYEKRKEATLQKVKAASPVLYWAKRYHKNTHLEEMLFTDMHYLVALYRDFHKFEEMAVIKSVQVGLSELFICGAHEEAARGLTVFYVLPKYEIRNRFVSNRIHRIHKNAGYYAHMIRMAKSMGGSERTSLVHFGRGGIAFVGSNVEDEFVEMPVDSAYVDEFDRCNQRNLLLLPDRLTASKYKHHRMISNPTVEGYGIDLEYSQSSKASWMMKCEHCGQRFVPNFFEHVVKQVGQNEYIPRNSKALTEDRLVCDKCGGLVDRLQKGEWVHEQPTVDKKGFRISQLLNKHILLRKLVKEWSDVASETQKQIFYNSKLGLAYSTAGSKINDWQLDLCKRRYPWPIMASPPRDAVRTMGVDVGSVLHVVVRERVRDKGTQARRLLWAGEVRDFSELRKLIMAWQPKRCVIDAMPEIHEVSKLKERHSEVYSSQFQESLIEMSVNKQTRLVKMDRTAILDAVKAAVDDEVMLIPDVDPADLCDGIYYSHLTASTRIFEPNEKDPKKSRFVWVESARPDHYFLAEAYCLQADLMLPVSGVFDFYNQEIDKAHKAGELTQPPETLSPQMIVRTSLKKPKTEEERQQQIHILEQIDTESFLGSMEQGYEVKAAKGRDEEEIVAEVLALLEGRVIVDLTQFERDSGLRGEAAKQFLENQGFAEFAQGKYRRGT
jgi:hypothetical protein